MDEFDRPPHHPGAKTGRSHPILWLIVILAVVGGVIWFGHTRSDSGGASQQAHGKGGGRFAANGPMPVAVVTAQKGQIPITVNALGTVTPLATVTVRTQIAGTLVQIGFQEGQMVQAGDFLAQIDPRPYELQLQNARGQLAKDQALLKAAQADLERYTTLLKQDSIASQQVDTQKALVQQYLGAVQTDQSQVDTAKLNLVYCRITAPISGRIGLRQVDLGNYVQTGDTNGIVVITQTQPISALFSVPEDNLPAVTKRLSAGATLPVTALDRSQTTTLATGALTTVDNVIDVSTGTVKMRAQFDNQDGSLFANQFVNIRLLVDTLSDVIVLPSSAVQRGTPGTYVYVVNPEDSTVKLTLVKLGPAAGENVAILSGLNGGETVVSDGGDKLKDGGKVLLPNAQQTSAAPGGGDGKNSAAGNPSGQADGKESSGQSAGGHHRHQKKKDQGDEDGKPSSNPPPGPPPGAP